MAGPSDEFWRTAQQIHSDMEDLVEQAGISVNVVPVREDDPAIALQVAKANLTRIQDALDAEHS
ncbi:MAG: hypothetical protein IJI97_07835 [Clostridia bacterium]|jgi:hypothetical protein|nr:hypothetical protein [Clostridia bacterium]